MSRKRYNAQKPQVEVSKKGQSAVVTVKMSRQLESQPVNRDSSRGWVNWGTRNDYPDQLSNFYYSSPTHKACCEFLRDAVVGDGIDYRAMKIDGTQTSPNYQYSWDEFLEYLALDYAIYGSFALQIIRNKDGSTYSFYHQPMSEVRLSPRDDDGVSVSAWICSDWSKTSTKPPVEIPLFGFTEDEEIKSGKPYLYVYQPYAPSVEYYPVPEYIAGLKPIQVEQALMHYDLRSVTNNFSASGILTLPEPDNEEDRKMVLDNIKAMFSGEDSANSLIVNFRVNGEEQSTEFVKIDKDANGSVNLFEQSNARNVDKIIAAHRIPSKSLIGYPSESASLGGDGNLMNVAFGLYNKTVANRARRNIVGIINKAFMMNGIDAQLILKPLRFDITDGADTAGRHDETVDETVTEDTEKATSDNNANVNLQDG